MQRKVVWPVIALCVATLVASFLAPRLARAQEPVQFKAADGTTIYGAYYPAKSSPQPVILLFHQAGSNRYEYAGIAPKLVAEGFSCLAIDQRWGGAMWGHRNETVHKLGRSQATAEPNVLQQDEEAALTWAKTRDPHGKFILWGSSYSASLVLMVAAAHPNEVAAVLAFSPGEYFESHPTLVRDAATKLRIPVFITSENDADALADATRIYEAVGSREKVHYKAQFAVHGSSTLRTDRNVKGAAANWAAVAKFLKQFEK